MTVEEALLIADSLDPALDGRGQLTALKVLASEVRRLNTDGPTMLRGSDGAGKPVVGTMREVLDDYMMAASVEADESRAATAEVRRLNAALADTREVFDAVYRHALDCAKALGD